MDPYHILPVAAMASLLAVLETNLKARKATVNPMQFKMQLGVQRILCFSMVPMLIGLKYPAGVYLYWIANSMFAMCQILLLNHPAVKKFLRLP
mmetsp:Transcript_44638/g.140865  ORF Transcript_44638/g.140865 Transcript_44638/m.140865 type:complete len:93 (+) Transcript_44638:198-476(+)